LNSILCHDVPWLKKHAIHARRARHMKPLLSPRELAHAIGVSESSIKRWIDDGLIGATKTAGGHRRIAGSEAIRFVRESRSILVRPDVLGLQELAAVEKDITAGGDDADRLFVYLKEGRAPEVNGLILSLYLGGQSVAEIIDGPFQTALEKAGELWTKEDSGIFWEHRATEIAIRAVAVLRTLFSPAADAVIALGGAPTGDPYILPSMSSAAVLESTGLRAENLGADIPLDSLMRAVETLRPSLVWLSLSVIGDGKDMEQQIDRLARQLSERGVRLVLGGTAVERMDLLPRPGLHIGESMRELEAFAKGLVANSVRSEQAAFQSDRETVNESRKNPRERSGI
jgi:excisionase family DNA binding protein